MNYRKISVLEIRSKIISGELSPDILLEQACLYTTRYDQMLNGLIFISNRLSGKLFAEICADKGLTLNEDQTIIGDAIKLVWSETDKRAESPSTRQVLEGEP